MDETFWMRYRDIGLVGIVFVVPGSIFNLSFTVMCLQNLHNYTLLLRKATRNPLFTPRGTSTLRRLTPSWQVEDSASGASVKHKVIEIVCIEMLG